MLASGFLKRKYEVSRYSRFPIQDHKDWYAGDIRGKEVCRRSYIEQRDAERAGCMETMIAIGSRGAVVVVVVVVGVVVVQYNILQSTLSSLPSQKIRLISPSRAKVSLQKEINRPSKKDEDGDIGKARAWR